MQGVGRRLKKIKLLIPIFFPFYRAEYITNKSKKELKESLETITIDEDIITFNSKNESEALFVGNVNNEPIVLYPIQTKHYSRRNIALPKILINITEQTDGSKVTIDARMNILHIFSVLLLCLISARPMITTSLDISVLSILLLGLLVLTVFFWIPCKKALGEIDEILHT